MRMTAVGLLPGPSTAAMKRASLSRLAALAAFGGLAGPSRWSAFAVTLLGIAGANGVLTGVVATKMAVGRDVGVDPG